MDVKSILTQAITEHIAGDDDPRNLALRTVVPFCNTEALDLIARELDVRIPIQHLGSYVEYRREKDGR